MKNNYYSYSQNARVFKKGYGDICLTVILELPRRNLKADGRKDAVNVLTDEIFNLLNDAELEKLLTPRKGTSELQ